MTLLEATANVIDAVKTHAPWELDVVLHRSIKRLEKRLEVLQRRHDNAHKKRLSSAWIDCQIVIKAKCSHCGFVFTQETFNQHVEPTGHGHIKSLSCPQCKILLIGIPK